MKTKPLHELQLDLLKLFGLDAESGVCKLELVVEPNSEPVLTVQRIVRGEFDSEGNLKSVSEKFKLVPIAEDTPPSLSSGSA